MALFGSRHTLAIFLYPKGERPDAVLETALHPRQWLFICVRLQADPAFEQIIPRPVDHHVHAQMRELSCAVSALRSTRRSIILKI
jgi:hypothetical protein